MKARVVADLKAIHAVKTSIAYDCCGDSGQMEMIDAFDVDGTIIDLSATNLQQTLDDFAWLLLRIHHEGFELEEGSTARSQFT